ncbi:hypothetical protein LWI28_025111 [Acer negundo]|uniref:Uncharacterized protein n=1 Tax=Acer negundo TaxID=4023 RepID=A0AAD5IKD3_ACENE|nr:hypothetical protein LWI28_025111 [Acer negundo]
MFLDLHQNVKQASWASWQEKQSEESKSCEQRWSVQRLSPDGMATMRVGEKGVRLKRSGDKGKSVRILKTKKKARLGIIQNAKLGLQKKGRNVRVSARSSELTTSSSDDCHYRNNFLNSVKVVGECSKKGGNEDGIQVVVDIGRVEVCRGVTQQPGPADEFSESELLRAIIETENVGTIREALHADEDLVQDSFNSDDMIQIAVVVEAESARLKTSRKSGGVFEATPIRHSMHTRNSKPRLPSV